MNIMWKEKHEGKKTTRVWDRGCKEGVGRGEVEF